MSDKIPITLEGKLRLEDELKHLKTVERHAVIQAISTARDLGDLSENAEYAAAREKQSFIEGRIIDIGDKLARAEVIDPKTIQSSKIVFGATVHILDDEGKESIFQIVGAPETDISKGRLSVTAPLARALIGKQIGDMAEVKSPKGLASYEITKIEYK